MVTRTHNLLDINSGALTTWCIPFGLFFIKKIIITKISKAENEEKKWKYNYFYIISLIFFFFGSGKGWLKPIIFGQWIVELVTLYVFLWVYRVICVFVDKPVINVSWNLICIHGNCISLIRNSLFKLNLSIYFCSYCFPW